MKDTIHHQLNQTQDILLSPESHSFNVSIAKSTQSILAATVFNHIFFWLRHNRAKGLNQIDGRTWMFESISEIAVHFQYLTERQIRDALDILCENKILLKANMSKNKFDKRNWYACAREEWLGFKKDFTIRQNCPIDQTKLSDDGTKMSDRKDKNGQSNKDIETKDMEKKYKKEAHPPSSDAVFLVSLFLKKIKEATPDIKPPNEEQWAKEMDALLRLDHRTKEDVQAVIEWMHSSKCLNGWFKANIRSPKSLRAQYDKLKANMKVGEESSLAAANRELLRNIKEEYPEQTKCLLNKGSYVLHTYSSKEISFNISPEVFKRFILQALGAEEIS